MKCLLKFILIGICWFFTLFGFVCNSEHKESLTTSIRPEYIHPEGVEMLDPYLNDFHHKDPPEDEEEDDYIPLPDHHATTEGLPIFLIEPKNSYTIKNKPVTLLCRAANALQIFFKCNGKRIATEQFEHVDPHNGVRVVESELNVTKNDVDVFFGEGSFKCECFAWNSKGHIGSAAVAVEVAYIKKQFAESPQSLAAEQGTNVKLRCEPPSAVPPSTLKWLRNGHPVGDDSESLVLPKVSLQDIANYTCVAENIAGRRESEPAVLTVFGSRCCKPSVSMCGRRGGINTSYPLRVPHARAQKVRYRADPWCADMSREPSRNSGGRVNGGWSEWGPWIPCRCGTTVVGKRRSRSCTEPAPVNDGAPCRGASVLKSDDCIVCPSGGIWTSWAEWSTCNSDCVRVRTRGCSGTCNGPTLQHAKCVDGLCYNNQYYYDYNGYLPLYIGISIVLAVTLTLSIAFFLWYRNKRMRRPGYILAAGTPKSYASSRDKTVPDLTRSCHEYWMTDNQYDIPNVRDSYSLPFGARSERQSSSCNQYEMKPYSPSGDSASSCCTYARTMTSKSSSCSSPTEQVTSISPANTNNSRVDVAVSLPTVPLDSSYRDRIFLTVVK